MQQITTKRPRLFFALAAATALVASPLVQSKTGDPPLFVLDPSGVPAVLESLDRNYGAILEVPEVLLEELPDPASVVPRAAHKVWLAPEIRVDRFTDGNGFPRLSIRATVKVLNAGDTVAEISCVYFDHNGTLHLDLGTIESISPATSAECTPPTTTFEGWTLIRSDRPVLVSGHYEVEGFEGGFAVQSASDRDLAIYPIDCEHPEGIEFACQFVAP